MKKALVVFLSMLFLSAGCSNGGKVIKVDVYQPELPEITGIGSAMWSFIDEDGNLYTWGFDSFNAAKETPFILGPSLGQGAKTLYNNVPTKIYSDVAYMVLGNRGLTKNGEAIEWGKLMENDPCVPRVFEENVAKVDVTLYLTRNGELYMTPERENIHLDKPYRDSRELILTNVRDFSGGYTYFALKDDGSVWTFCFSSMTLKIVDRPEKLLDNVKRIISNGQSVLFLKNDGSLWSCGNNEYGQCGNGEHGDLNNNTDDCVVTEPHKMAEDVIDVWAAGSTTFYLTKDNKLYACGRNYNDILLIGGNGQMDRSNYPDFTATPVLIMEDVKQMEYHGMGMFVLKTDNTVWSWGYADRGGLGNGVYYEGDNPSEKNFTVRLMQTGEALFSQPTQIMDNVKRLFNETGGLRFAQKTDGTIWYWGYGGIYADEDDDWDTEMMRSNDVTAYLKNYIIPTPIEFSVDTYFQTALEYIAAQGIDISQYQAARDKDQ